MTRACRNCGAEFEPRRPNSQYCSTSCQVEKRRAVARERYAANPEPQKARSRKYHAENRDELLPAIRERSKRNRLDHPERYEAYHQANRERRSEYHRQYYLDNSEKIKRRNGEYKRANPGVVLRHCHRRRQLKISGDADVVQYAPIDVFERDGWTCYLCDTPVDRGAKYPDRLSATVDHVHPISMGGLDCFTNVRCAHSSCNARKGPKSLQELTLPMKPPPKEARRAGV